MVRSSWFFLVFYEASRNLDLQSVARNNHVEACRPHAMCAAHCTAGTRAHQKDRPARGGPVLGDLLGEDLVARRISGR